MVTDVAPLAPLEERKIGNWRFEIFPVNTPLGRSYSVMMSERMHSTETTSLIWGDTFELARTRTIAEAHEEILIFLEEHV